MVRPSMLGSLVLCGCAWWIGCSDDTSSQIDAATDASVDLPVAVAEAAAETAPDTGADTGGNNDISVDATADAAAPDSGTQGLPFTYTRPPAGQPVTAQELTAITDKYLDLLKQTRFFEMVDDRVHGWPESDPQKRYWYGTWWSGVVINKTSGKVTFQHLKGGADNNGLRTGPLLEGACYATQLWSSKSAMLEHLTRKMIRGLSSWILAMQRQPNDPAGTLLTRASYPVSIASTDGGRDLYIDYSLNRPGDDNSACEYVHIPQNPYWGDIWVKNKRSKDCIGHMLRAIATLGDCASALGVDTAKDRQEMQDNYVKWAKKVEDDNWTIATYDKSGKVWFPPDSLAHFYGLGNAECTSMIAIRLFGRGNPGTLACGNGIHPLEWLALQNDHNGEIIRSFHEAAVMHALISGNVTVAQTMLTGLAKRIEEGMVWASTNNWPVHMDEGHLTDLIVHSANTGVPLTWAEVRYVHKQIEKAHTQFTAMSPAIFKVFDQSTPDGTYPYNPGGSAIRFRSLALALGTCVATYRNPASMPVLDCAKVKAWTP